MIKTEDHNDYKLFNLPDSICVKSHIWFMLQVNWHAADVLCRLMGKTLVQFSSIQDLDRITTFIQKNGKLP